MTTTARPRRRPGGRPAPPRGASTLLVAALVLGLAACTSTGDSDAGEAPSSSATPPAPPLPTTVKVGVVTGRVGAQEKERAVSNVTRAVDGWFDAAYVAGDYPRAAFDDAFPRFTKGAAKEAVQDEALMSNADIGSRIDRVTPKARRLTIDLLGVRGVAQAATARVRLVFVTEGEVARRVTVSGRLRLVRQNRVWRVFGYDVTKGQRPVGGGESGSASPSGSGAAS